MEKTYLVVAAASTTLRGSAFVGDMVTAVVLNNADGKCPVRERRRRQWQNKGTNVDD